MRTQLLRRSVAGLAWLLFAGAATAQTNVPPSPPPAPIPDGAKVIFSDNFNSDSAGEMQPNLVGLPPPQGLGYATTIDHGRAPVRWIHVDKFGTDDPRRGFWAILDDEAVLVQAGRGLVTALFAQTPLPADAIRYRIQFAEIRYDNDPIGYILGASEVALGHDGQVLLYATQVPGTDDTTNHIYQSGALGQAVHRDLAFMHQWVNTVIEVDGIHVRWFRNDQLIAEGEVPDLRRGGYFGIFQSSERNTRWDNVRIMILP